MASETMQLLNLSPIPELSEMELSSVIEQLSGLSGVSELNGELTDRKVEDILREAEELIDKSGNNKYDAVDSKGLMKKDKQLCENNNESIGGSNTVANEEKNISDHSGTGNDILNLILFSEENSESLNSLKNEMDNSQSEVSSCQTSRSLTNHIQSTINSLRECSKKIESQTKNSHTKSNNATDLAVYNKNHKVKKFSSDDGLSKVSKSTVNSCKCNSSYCGEDNENIRSLNSNSHSTKSDKKTFKKPDLRQNKVFNKYVSKESIKKLNFNESVKTQDCFERLYKSKPYRLKKDNKIFKKTENIEKRKKSNNANTLKRGNSFNFFTKGKDSDMNSILDKGKVKPYCSKQFDDEQKTTESCSEDINYLTEDIDLVKCLELLNSENECLSNETDVPTSYTEFAEKIFNHYSVSVNTLQKEIEDLRSQLKKNNTSDCISIFDSNMIQKFHSQENLIHTLREENSKLFKEIKEIKGQLKMDRIPERNDDLVKEDLVNNERVTENSNTKVENLQETMVASCSQKNGILRLEEQFSLLKQKYDKQIAKLESENKKLKETIADINSYVSPTKGLTEKSRKKNSVDIALQTEKELNDFGLVEMISPQNKSLNGCNAPEKLIRSVSLENCKVIHEDQPIISHSCETVITETSPMKNSYSQTHKEISNLGIQCSFETQNLGLDLVKSESNAKKKEIFREIQKFENKENLGLDKRKIGKMRTNIYSGNQVLALNKQRKMSEHETQLMVTLRALHSEIAVKDRDNKKMKNELEILRNQIKRLNGGVVKHRSDNVKKICHIGTQTIGLGPKMQEPYDPVMFQVSKELENENEELKLRLNDMEKMINQLKDKRIHDLQILQKLHEEEIGKLASRLNTQTALTNHLHSLLTDLQRMSDKNSVSEKKTDEANDGEGREEQNDDGKPSTPKETQSHSEKSPSENIQQSSMLMETGESIGKSDISTRKKKERSLRFVLPDAAEEQQEVGGSKSNYSLRYAGGTDTGSVVNFRITSLPKHKPIRVSDILRAVHVVAEKKSGSSIYLETVNNLMTSSSLLHRTIANMLGSETKSEANCRLLLSTHFRNLDGVVEALKMGADVNIMQDHQTPLALATENNDKLIVKHLLTVKNINVNSRNIFGQTPLLIAIRNGYTEIAIWLLNYGANVNLSDNLQRTALHEALFQENSTLVKRILDSQCQLETMDCFGEKPIYTTVVKKPNVNLLNDLLKAGAVCEYINEINGISLLSRAILNSLSYKIIQRLIEAGANVNEEDIFCKRTPLHIAAIINSVPIAKLLIENGADPNVKTISGLTALDLAIYYMCFDIAKYLAPITISPNISVDILKSSLFSNSNKASTFISSKIGTSLRLLAKRSKSIK